MVGDTTNEKKKQLAPNRQQQESFGVQTAASCFE